MADVAGVCPMGCGRTLFLGAGGHVTCSNIACPEPCAVDTILGDRETEHIVELDATTFTVRHPLRERLGDALLTCRLHADIASRGSYSGLPGVYRVTQIDGRWTWYLLKEVTVRG